MLRCYGRVFWQLFFDQISIIVLWTVIAYLFLSSMNGVHQIQPCASCYRYCCRPLCAGYILDNSFQHHCCDSSRIGSGIQKFNQFVIFPFFSGSRATVTYRFGFVALDILNVIQADAGVYTCRATNVMGQAETSANLRVTGKLPFLRSATLSPF